jgi:hypothetical protein
VASSKVVQERPDVERAEETRQRSIVRYAEDARAWWESGRIYYIVKLSLGGTIAQLTSHADVEGEDVSGILQQIEAIGWHLFHVGYVYQPLKEAISRADNVEHHDRQHRRHLHVPP